MALLYYAESKIIPWDEKEGREVRNYLSAFALPRWLLSFYLQKKVTRGRDPFLLHEEEEEEEEESMRSSVVFFTIFCLNHFCCRLPYVACEKKEVRYDGRSIIVGGRRELLFSGSIHYPRATPQMWPDLIKKAKLGGLNVIQTYVFWNVHEPVEGQFDFTGNKDLVKFIKLIADEGLYVTLRLGPFVQGEWNNGGIPYWIREVKNMTLRTDNEPFKYHMEKYTRMIIDMMKEEKLFSPQGGPIILAQIENEYDTIQPAFKESGKNYVQWAANMALSMQVGVPWIMCKQRDAPGPVINSCNGRHCGDTFTGPNHPSKPYLWTENWTAQFRVFGDPPSQRSAEDIAYSVARFFARNGSLTNYYMYYGGTNFARTSSSYTMTRYYDEAPLDEYGLLREPKWGHLRDLHSALRLCRKPLLWGVQNITALSDTVDVTVHENQKTNICSAFITNNSSRDAVTVDFRGKQHHLPPHSISILPDCNTVIYNTQKIVAQHNARSFKGSKVANRDLKWEMWTETVPTTREVPISLKSPLEQYWLTKDTTDYAWYTTSIELFRQDLSSRHDIEPVLRVLNFGHSMLAFVNGEFAGFGHGSKLLKHWVLEKPMKLKPGVNHITLLGTMVGMPDSGVYLERRIAGPHGVSIFGLNTGTLDILNNGWGSMAGLEGERLRVFTQKGSHRVHWRSANGTGPPLTWYKTYFDAPEGDAPVALRLTGMGKGAAWVNGKGIGRFWLSYLSPLGQPSQSEYHVPRDFLKPTDNLLVLLEEVGGDPDGVRVQLVTRDTICSFITEDHPPHVRTWARDDGRIHPVVDVESKASLQCSADKVVVAVDFASFGNPDGSCGSYVPGNCTSPISRAVVEKICLGKNSCSVPVERSLFEHEGDPCLGVSKTLAVQVRCGRPWLHNPTSPVVDPGDSRV